MSQTISPIVLTDFHHAGLLHSLILLFEGRMGGQVYRPIGTQWAEQGFWKIYDHPATIEQFLGVGGNTPDGSPPLNNVVNQPTPEVYLCQDIDSGLTNRAITLAGFLGRHFDIVIASIPQHIEPFKRLCELHPDHPKLIYQIGNSWTIEAGLAPNILASAVINGVPENTNFLTYHQEFDLETFSYYPSYPGANIYSFVNCFNVAPHHAADWSFFQEVEGLMPGWNFKSYGGQCRDGAAHGAKQVAEKMREARFIWHVKNGGDGYGHILFNSAAIGRPLITKKSYYQGKLGEVLMRDGETCINIDGLSVAQVIDKINYYSEPGRYNLMVQAVHDNFVAHVDFGAEATRIREFVEKLL